MIIYRFWDWEIEVDTAETAEVQRSRPSGSPEKCGCLHCKNFVAVRDSAYPAEFLELLERLGIPVDRESEIYHCGEIEPRLHFYGGGSISSAGSFTDLKLTPVGRLVGRLS
jgi:hypothetical protein